MGGTPPLADLEVRPGDESCSTATGLPAGRIMTVLREGGYSGSRERTAQEAVIVAEVLALLAVTVVLV